MKALSIRQPWAWCIVNGFKGVENRDWDTKFRGEFLIHTGLKIDHEAYPFIRSRGVNVPPPEQLYVGGIVGMARLINTVPVYDRRLLTAKDVPWFFGKYGFILDSAKPVEFMPLKGRLGFFEVGYDNAQR